MSAAVMAAIEADYAHHHHHQPDPDDRPPGKGFFVVLFGVAASHITFVTVAIYCGW